MGNGAMAPTDVATFWFNLATGRMLSHQSMEQWLDFHPLPPFTDYGNYGLGVFDDTIIIGLAGTESCGKYAQLKNELPIIVGGKTYRSVPLCVDESSTIYIGGYSHSGRDWGSEMMDAGYYPAINASISIATNSYQGMSTHLGHPTFFATHDEWFVSAADGGTQKCEVQALAIRTRFPDFPKLDCARGNPADPSVAWAELGLGDYLLCPMALPCSGPMEFDSTRFNSISIRFNS